MKWQLALMVMFGLGVCHASAVVATAPVSARRPLPTEPRREPMRSKRSA
jgi:uncharacterized membrane protein YadS